MSDRSLVSTEWLASKLQRKDVKLIDASWRMPGKGNAIEHYEAEHIPGAVYFDIDAVSDVSTQLPHMLPSPQAFSDAVGKMGIGNDDFVVVYDDAGLFSAARVWWMFRAMGHEHVAVLDGGLPKWRREGRPVTADTPLVTGADYVPAAQPAFVASHEDVRSVLTDDTVLILDARASDRFKAEAPEPRAGLRSGHMPGAVNVPFGDVLEDSGELKPISALRDLFRGIGVTDNRRVITTCGSGVTAAVLSLALEVGGFGAVSLYDGSWTEWGDENNDSELFPVTRL